MNVSEQQCGSAFERQARERTSPVTFYRQVVAELRKVVWPTQEQLVTYFIVVMVFVVVMMALVSLLDLASASPSSRSSPERRRSSTAEPGPAPDRDAGAP